MKIVVLVKEVPDTYGDRKLDLETGLANRAASEAVLDEICERALEVALSTADSSGDVDVVLLTMGPESAVTTIRKGLAMGASSAVHIADESLLGADLGLTSEVLAAALERIGFDLVIAGNLSTDGSGSAVPAMVAERLGVPHVTALSTVEITPDEVRGARVTENGVAQVSAKLPAVVSITEALPDARFPNFKGIMGAKKKPYEMLTPADLGIAPEAAGTGRSIVIALSERPPRGAGVKIVDEGDAGSQLAEFLVANRLA
ncbi:electron transfer flavoprotein subunit beta/FixA family protein [Georgenia sp. SYP-B2076]|uniref:electron transfer flavoprotein subunit beta/FixA family protein n=1 Tax=Georgenia sp. SYP-B2076 TaxID=2495881 RepID=UPI000F8D4A9A|nr:electron transfer flavoprotein subunit beta/FixA family protein [Georgenia sp. SYP-B2076]